MSFPVQGIPLAIAGNANLFRSSKGNAAATGPPVIAKPINLIVACTENRVIGREGRLPFDIPEDKRWFHDKTAGSVVVLGRICFEAWPQVISDGRRAVVLSSNPDSIRATAFKKPGAPAKPSLLEPAPFTVVSDVPSALQAAQALPGEIMVCGGQRIYEETLPLCDRLILTLVHAEMPGDRLFPDWHQLAWRESWRKESSDANYRYTFSILERVK